ncbi:MAG: homogentisate phytyltransferase / homogentisate geranylgeranyltransferase [Solirubrobacteraceae bacterium]|nr:homogentisate phytyltransferase / homogentisate geranylgeranyltransferase [Solirubrobacteraceae bacterium]
MSRPPVAVGRARPRAAAWPPVVLWRFSRPHTLIGTSLSILGLYAIAASADRASGVVDLLWTLLAGACVNVFIVGINQIQDVEIDRLNKPWLPIAAGALSLPAARRIVAVAGLAPLVMAVTQGVVEVVAVSIALAVGWAYSCPPLRLKRFAALAAGSITFVRALVVNLGVWLHVAGRPISAGVWALTAVTVPFSFAIAVLKDVPDIEGDRRFDIATFSVRLGPRPVLALGVGALTLAGVGMAVAGPLLLPGASPALLVGGHVAGLAALWRWALRVDPADPRAVAAFYQRVWVLFFCEYLLVPASYLIG